jgi:S1-C subfamily serine protease
MANSDGTLLYSRELAVGMNSYGAVNLTCINFAIPSNLVGHVAPEIIQTEIYDNPWLGFSSPSRSLPSYVYE